MNQIKEDLKSSNKFEPNLAFEKNNFGQLNLSEYSSFEPFKSNILKGQQPLKLIKLCEFDLQDTFKLLYRASEHGFDANNFHSKCDGKANTLTIFKASECSFIFGGFTSATWIGSGQWKSDPNAFLFSLTNKDNQPCKMNIDPNQHQYAIYGQFGFGPSFGVNYGHGNDIFIASNANANSDSLSNLGSSYKHAQYASGTNEARSFLAGSHKFKLSEIEVYQKE